MSDLAIQWLIVFVDASLKAALVALVAAAGLALLRVRDSNLRHRVWTGVLCGMILLPALTQIVPAFRLPFTINPEWFAVLNRTDDGSGPEQIADRSGADEEIAAIEPAVDQQPAMLDLESTARGDARAMAGRSDWPGAPGRWPGEFRGSPPQSIVPPDNALAVDPSNQSATAPVEAPIESEPAVSDLPPPALPQPISRVILSHLPLLFWSVWIAGGLALGLRLLAGLWMARALRRASRQIGVAELARVREGDRVCGAGISSAAPQAGRLHHKDNDVHPEAHAHQNQSPSPLGGEGLGVRGVGEFAAYPLTPGPSPPRGEGRADLAQAAPIEHPMPRRSVPILACPLIRVPLTLGVLRPQILLPLDWIDWSTEKLRAVLAHERTHAERGDCAMALLAEMNRCLYWFHPLAWWLRRRLAALAEAACDDAAIGSTGDRASYARHLLEVAATARAHRGRLIAGGVSMARRSNVETRITAILDFTRPLSQRLTWGTALILIGIIVPLIALAASLRPSNGQIEQSLPAVVALDENPPTDTEASSSDLPSGDLSDAASESAVTSLGQDPVQGKPETTAVAKTEDSKLSTEYSVLSTQAATGTVIVPEGRPVAQTDASPSTTNPAQIASLSGNDITYRGRVLDPDGKPFAGATVYVLGWYWSPEVKHVPLAEARSGADGVFEISCQNPILNQNVWHGRMSGEVQTIAAIADGFGPGFIDSVKVQRDELLTLRLVRDDVPIKGQVLDLEGRPVAGVKVSVGDIFVFKGEDLTEWLDSIRQGETRSSGRNRLAQGHIPGYESAASRSAVTDAEGRFRLTGVGRERAAEIVLDGPTIGRSEATIVTRRIPPMVETTGPDFTKRHSLFGADCQITLMPTRPVVGTVRDETGKPLAGVTVVNSTWVAGVTGDRIIRSVTDQEGHYRLMGLPKIKGIEITAVPNDAQPYFAQAADVPESTGLEPVTVDFEMHRGIWITGRVTDKASAAPLAARVYYVPFRTNEHAQKRTPEFDKDGNIQGFRDEHTTGPDGTYRVVGLPGRAIVGAWSLLRPYRAGVGADAIEGLDKYGHFPTYHMQMGPKWPNSLVEINPPAGVESVICDVQLDAGESVRVTIVDPDGQPLVGYTVEGRTAISHSPSLHERPEFEAINLGPDETRTLLIQHESRKLGRVVQMRLDAYPNRATQIRLGPLATVVGRLLTVDGDPLAGVALRFGVLPGGDFGKELRGAVTDKQGRFAHAVLSGCDYSVMAEGKAILAVGLDYGFFVIRETLSVKPGETIDLGDVRVAPSKPETKNAGTEETNTSENASASPGATSSAVKTGRSVRGRVVDSKGQPIAGVVLKIPVLEKNKLSKWKVDATLVTKGTTDADGRFLVELKHDDFAPARRPGWPYLPLIALHPDFAVEWFDLPALGDTPPADIILYPEQVIRGRMLDAEGRPVAGAKVAVRYLRAPRAGNSLDAILAERKKQEPGGVMAVRFLDSDSLPNSIGATSDDQGRFVLSGVAPERICEIKISAPNFATTSLLVANRQGLDAAPYNQLSQRMRGRISDLLVGPDFTHVGVPGLTIEGRVTAADGKPVANLDVGAAPMLTLFTYTVTDADGRYRLTGLPRGLPVSVAFAIEPHDDLLPYMVSISPGADEALRSVDVEMKRGILVSGSVVDPSNLEKVSATVTFVPLPDNEFVQQPGYQNVGGGAMLGRVDDQGNFQLAVIPGPGVLMVETFDRYGEGSVFRQATVNEEDVTHIKPQTQPDGSRFFTGAHGGTQWLDRPNAVKYVNFSEDGGPQTVNLKLDRGKTVELEFVDADGQSVAQVAVWGVSEQPGARATRLKESRTTIFALGADRPRRVVGLHAERGLAASVTLTGDEAVPVRLVLRKSASVHGRAVDESGDPIPGGEFFFYSDSVREMQAFLNSGQPEPATGKDGRFRIANLVPGEHFQLSLRLDGKFLNAKLTKEQQTLKPGQDVDLGDVVFTPQKRQLPPHNETGKATPTPPLDPPVNGGRKDASPASAEKPASPSPSTGRAGVGTASDKPVATTISINGVVLKPDGKPAAGATVRAAAPLWAMLGPIVGDDFKSPMSETKADAQGRFSISFPTQPFGDLGRLDERWQEIWKKTIIAASLDRFGPGWVTYDEIDSQQPVTLRLIDDLPVRGRVVDLEGRPVAGARVKLDDLHGAAGDDLSAWIEGIKAGELPWTVYDKARRFVDPRLVGLPGVLTTGADGTIELHGMGRERLLQLTFEGETAAHRSATLVTRKMGAIRQTITSPPFEATEPVFGAEFTFTADPARPIEGVVRHAETGEPLAGVSVESYKLVGYPSSNHRVLKTKTDKLGRFRLVGMPKGSGNRLMLVPNDEQPFFIREVEVPDPVGLGPAKMEIELHRGIWITGRVTDKATGDGVPGVWLLYLPLRSNEYAQKTPEFQIDGNVDGDNQMRYVTKPDGTYRLVGLPGRAIVGAESVLQHYCRGVGYDAIDAPKYMNSHYFDTYRNPINPSPKWPSVMREINPPADAKSVSLDLELDAGQSLRIHVVSPDGKPLAGVSVTGLTWNSFLEASREPTLVAANFGPGETRSVLFHHQERKVGRVVTIGAEQLGAGEMTVELQSCATLVGRILNSDGLPITGMAITPFVLPGGDFGKRLPSDATDADGRFRVTLLPGCRYSFGGEGGGFQFVTVAEELSIEPGEAKNLGTLMIDKDGKVVRTDPAAQPPPGAKKSNTDVQKSSAAIINGTILNPDGKPAARAHVAAIGMRHHTGRGGDLDSRGDVLAETSTDGDGRFRMKLSGISSKTHTYAHVIASSENAGLGWQRIDPDERDVTASFRLPAEQPIRGRLIDIEGQAAAEVRVSIRAIWSAFPNGRVDDGVQYDEFDNAPKAWPQPATTDAKGSFVIHHSPAGHFFFLGVAGTGQIAAQSLRINAGAPEPQEIQNAAYRALFKDVKADEETLFAMAPAQIFEGVVRYADTGEPAPHARLTIWASSQEGRGSSSGLAGKADAQGRYRINPYPGVRFGINAYPPDGVPYLTRKIRDIIRKDGARVKQVDVTLPRGSIVRGRVVEAGTKIPVSGAALQYIPERQNNPNATDDIVTGWEGIQLSGDDGAFEIAVLPGPGTLLVNGPEGKFVMSEIGSRQLDRGIAGGQRNYAHAILHVNPKPNSDPLDLTIELRRGATISGRIVTADGEPVNQALVLTRLSMQSGDLTWRGFPVEVLSGRFELSGLAEGIEYPVHFLDPKNRLGATAFVKSNDNSPTVVLLPCGQASATITDESGKPMVGYFPALDMVLSPGPDRFEAAADAPGVLAGDTAYVLNIDRTNYQKVAVSDDQGRITYPALIPGARYRIITYEKGIAINLKEFLAESGKTLELGKIAYITAEKAARQDQKDAKAAAPAKTGSSSLTAGQSTTTRNGDTVTLVHGRIDGPDGKPVVKAHVAVVGSRIRPERGGDLSSRSDVLAESTTDDDGRFEMKLSGISSKTHSQAHVIARSDDSGLAWRRIDPDARDVDVSFDLLAEQVIRGRLIDIEGQPAGAVRLSVQMIMPRSATGARVENMNWHRFDKPPLAWPPSVTADQNGKFAIRGIATEHGVYLDIQGTDRFAPQWLSLNTGLPEQRPENDLTYRELVKNLKPGEEAVLPLAPAQIFEGVVRFADTGEPAPHARLTIWASQQATTGSMHLIAGKADAQGRYRINPNPGVRFGITAYPPDGVPYLIREIPDITRKDGPLVKQVDVTLPRGVLVRGRVVESATKSPIAGAMIQYVPESFNNRNAADDIITGWQGIQLSGENGEFEIAVLPGPGTLLANGPNKQFVLQEIGLRQLERGLPGGDRNYAHAIQRVNPEPDSLPLELTLAMHRGATISGRITNATGEPVEFALMMTRLNINPAELFWRGFPVELIGGRFELPGLGEGHEFPVHFLDAKNRLGATVVVKAGDRSPTVVLVPCGQAVATFTDASGKPLAEVQPDFEMVVTPGPHRFGSPAMSLASLTADAAFVANIDRTNYRPVPKTDADGRITFPALIPGATYRISTFKNGRAAVLKDFVAESGKTLELGKFTIEASNEQ